MRELKILTSIVVVCVVGVVITFGGSLWTAYKSHQNQASQIRPEDQIPVPATAQ
jgi:hypothetical protein